MLMESFTGFSFNLTKDEPKDDCKQASRQSNLQRAQSFIRAHDLDTSDENVDTSSFRKGSQALVHVDDSGSGAVINSLVIIGLSEAVDESERWIPISSTERTLSKRVKTYQNRDKIDDAPVGPWINAASGAEVFVWSSVCVRPGHGSDYPVVKARGLIPASARAVVDLLLDNDRVKTYNNLALGRQDELILTKNTNSSVHSSHKCPAHGVPGECRIMRSKSHPPLTRKPLEFRTLFHARQLDDDFDVPTDGVAYITVGRSVWENSDGTADGSDTSSTRCEIILAVNLVREVKTSNGEEWCELTSITHAVSPGIPIFIAKQVGLLAAENYIKDIRRVFEN